MSIYQFNTEEKTLTCKFEGRLDTMVSLKIQEEFKIELDKYEDKTLLKIIFDFAGATFISSSFIRICVSGAQSVQKGNFSIIHCDPFIKKTFKIAGLDTLLNVS